MTRVAPWVLALVAALVAGGAVRSCQDAERGVGRATAALEAAEAARDRLAARRAVVDTQWRRDTMRLRSFVDRWDTAKVGALQAALDSARRHPAFRAETIPVPVSAIVIADSTILSCQRVRVTCEARVALADSLTANAERRVRLTERLVGAPRTAAGLAYDPLTGRWGVAVDRDFGRLRVGASVTPGTVGVRLALWW